MSVSALRGCQFAQFPLVKMHQLAQQVHRDPWSCTVQPTSLEQFTRTELIKFSEAVRTSGCTGGPFGEAALGGGQETKMGRCIVRHFISTTMVRENFGKWAVACATVSFQPTTNILPFAL